MERVLFRVAKTLRYFGSKTATKYQQDILILTTLVTIR